MKPRGGFRLSVPVGFIIFNRPATTARVFAAIRQAEPQRLLVIGDGPRAGHPDDAEKCAAARAVIDQVDWNCEVLTNYTERNMGCERRVSSGLDWVFSRAEEAIILEDDCLPHPTFFRYCAELLDRYRNDTRVMHISGNLYGRRICLPNDASYGFCMLPQVWGWATWERAWRTFDRSLEKWSRFQANNRLSHLPFSRYVRRRLSERWQEAAEGRIDTWDFQWHFSVISNGGLAVVPRCNLISNIGFSDTATHTLRAPDARANCTVHSMEFPLKHPEFVLNDQRLTEFYATKMLGRRGPTRHVMRAISRLRSLVDSV